jgi:glycerol-3-phosphate dehydrogenase (NAD(P)+)
LNTANITVVGAGAWGTTVANLLAHNVRRVCLWAAQRAHADEMRQTGTNAKYLPGVPLHPLVMPVTELDPPLFDSDLFVWAIPIQFLRARLRWFAPHLKLGIVCVNLGKGIEEETLARPSGILLEECATAAAVGSLVGPNIASEVAAGLYAEAMLGLTDDRLLEELAACFTTPSFRVHTTTDIDGIEVSAALKNVCAIAAGLCDGLRCGANTKSLVIAGCLKEIRRLGQALAAEPCTFLARCTIGDVLTSCYSEGGRNRRIGEHLGQGHALEQAVAMLNGRIAEGLATCRACHGLRTRLGLRLPVVESLCELLDGQINARTCLRKILTLSVEGPNDEPLSGWADGINRSDYADAGRGVARVPAREC